MIEHNLYFNKTYANDLNCVVSSYPTIPLLTEDYEEVEIEGRNGNLIINKGTYRDRSISVTFRVLKPLVDYWEKIDSILDWLSNIEDNRLIYDRDDKCFNVKKVIFADLSKEIRQYGEFTVTFLCEPFLYDLKSTKKIITKEQKIKYLGNIEGEPTLKIYGNGNIQLTINGETMQIDNVNSYIIVNSYLLNVVDENGLSKDNDTLGNFPTFTKGNNTISFSSNVDKIEIEYINRYR